MGDALGGWCLLQPQLGLGKTDPHAQAASLAQLVLALEPSPHSWFPWE